jgi:hypothetical protein
MRNVLDGVEDEGDDVEEREARASCSDEQADVSSQPVLQCHRTQHIS